jgi:hypothetical protein
MSRRGAEKEEEMRRKRVTLNNRGLGILMVNLRLLLGSLQKNPLSMTQWFTRPIYEVATRMNLPG